MRQSRHRVTYQCFEIKRTFYSISIDRELYYIHPFWITLYHYDNALAVGYAFVVELKELVPETTAFEDADATGVTVLADVHGAVAFEVIDVPLTTAENNGLIEVVLIALVLEIVAE